MALTNKSEDLTGRRFGKLLVIGVAAKENGNDRKYWLCECDCGALRKNQVTALVRGASTTCGQKGCKDTVRRTHGASRTALYKQWAAMKYRCSNPKTTKFAYYGGKGIAVCERWLDFEVFAQDVGPRPSKRHSLDRIDPDGNYEPDNVRWATYEQQNGHLGARTAIVIDGVTRTIAQWARHAKLNVQTVRTRISRGWSGADLIRPPLTPIERGQSYRRAHAARQQLLEREIQS